MPIKVRRLKALLRRSGFRCRPGKGSHSIWTHPQRPGMRLVLTGADGDDARPYQEARARKRAAALCLPLSQSDEAL
jgi:predicted RNA binding protein YcfA (HicA-like mRNA interferase family)